MIAIGLGLALSLAGVVTAYLGWRRGARGPIALTVVLWAAATVAWGFGFGAEIGTALAIEAGSLIAFAFILSRVERRTHREGKVRVVPVTPPARGRWWRGTLRTLVAGPLGLAAAIGLGVAVALAAPLAEQTRLILAGLIVPSLWAGFMVWTLASTRPGRTALMMAASGGIGFAIALMPRG